jgi:hypothetical protein
MREMGFMVVAKKKQTNHFRTNVLFSLFLFMFPMRMGLNLIFGHGLLAITERFVKSSTKEENKVRNYETSSIHHYSLREKKGKQ